MPGSSRHSQSAPPPGWQSLRSVEESRAQAERVLRAGARGGEPAPSGAARNPALAGYHRLMLAPVGGAAVLAVRWLRSRGDERRELGEALKWQLLLASVFAVHLGLQIAIWGVGELHEASSTSASPGEARLVHAILAILTVLNLGAMAGEWGVLAVFGLRAASGKPYPLRLGLRG